MEFKKIHSDIQVICVGDEVVENTTDLFVRRIKKDLLVESDFRSYWEEGKRPPLYSKETVCDHKGVSVYKHNNDLSIASKMMKLFGKARSFKPALLPIYCKFKFKPGAGKVWVNGKYQPYHCNFFKEDGFSVDLIDVAEIKRCENV